MKYIVRLLSIFFVFFIISGCEKNNWPIVLKSKVTYKVSGTASEVIIMYRDETGSNKIKGISSSSALPWKYEFRVKPDTYVFLQAKNNTASGEVVVEILKGSKVIFTDKSSIPYGTATCSGYIK
ncbi:MAG: hypothetical protein N2Z72_03620 [Bacteroidales bacterium]|nr:hypothetical protein [Bacteroidales bacterium]